MVFLVADDDAPFVATGDCIDNVTQVVEDEYGLDVVVEGDEPLDPVILDEFTVCNETFISDSVLKDKFIFLDDSAAPTYFCVDKLLDAYDENEDVVVAITSLLVDDGCDESIDELLYEIDYALDKEESYYQLVEDLLDYYGYDDVAPVDEPRTYVLWYKPYRNRRSRHRKRHYGHERYHRKHRDSRDYWWKYNKWSDDHRGGRKRNKDSDDDEDDHDYRKKRDRWHWVDHWRDTMKEKKKKDSSDDGKEKKEDKATTEPTGSAKKEKKPTTPSSTTKPTESKFPFLLSLILSFVSSISYHHVLICI